MSQDAKPEPLAAGTPTPDAALREARADAEHWQAQFEAAHWERAELRQALDAARAETEAARYELRRFHEARAARPDYEVLWAEADKRAEEAEALAAELVEGLRRLAQEAELDGLAAKAGWDCWVANAQALLSRARALGVGGEKEKNDG